jgi:hypothetical protein
LHRLAKPESGVDHQRASGNGFDFHRTGFFARHNRACKAGAFSYTCDAEYSLRRAGGVRRRSCRDAQIGRLYAGAVTLVLPNLQFGSEEYKHLQCEKNGRYF